MSNPPCAHSSSPWITSEIDLSELCWDYFRWITEGRIRNCIRRIRILTTDDDVYYQSICLVIDERDDPTRADMNKILKLQTEVQIEIFLLSHRAKIILCNIGQWIFERLIVMEAFLFSPPVIHLTWIWKCAIELDGCQRRKRSNTLSAVRLNDLLLYTLNKMCRSN